MRTNLKTVDWKLIFISAGLTSLTMAIFALFTTGVGYIEALLSGLAFPFFGLLLVAFSSSKRKTMDNQSKAVGKIKPIKFKDLVNGITLEVKVSDLYTIILIDGREYYFNSDTGDFDGTGQECKHPIVVSDDQ